MTEEGRPGTNSLSPLGGEGRVRGHGLIIIRPEDEVLSPGDTARVADVARRGGVIVFPTDTFYALGADPRSPAGVGKVFSLKGRDRTRPLLLLLDSVRQVELFAVSASPAHRLLMDAFWPGPLTLLFPARGGFPGGVASPAGDIALRVPGSALCRAVLTAAGGALTGTSANRSGEEPPADAASALRSLGPGPDLAVEGGTLGAARVSTILKLEKGGATVLRGGAVTLEAVLKVLSAGR